MCYYSNYSGGLGCGFDALSSGYGCSHVGMDITVATHLAVAVACPIDSTEKLL